MSDWRLSKTIESADGTQRVEFRASADGKLFTYSQLEWMPAAEEDEGALGEGYWMIGPTSGYFDNLADCERDARVEVAWLRDGSARG